MDQVLLVGFILCHCSSLLLTSFILYTDLARWRSSNDTFFEKGLRAISHSSQILITCIAAGSTGVALHRGLQASWMEPLFVSTLEVNVTMMVARNLRGFARPAWIASCFYVIGLVHVALFLIYSTRSSARKRTHETFLYLGGLATLAATVSAEPLYTHARAGGSHTGFKRLLIALVLSNAAVASCCLGTALTVYAHSMSNATISDQIYQPLLLACASTQLLCPLVFCTGRAAIQQRGSTRLGNDLGEGSNIEL